MPQSAHIYISDETARLLALLERRWGLSRSGTIAQAVKLAAEREE